MRSNGEKTARRIGDMPFLSLLEQEVAGGVIGGLSYVADCYVNDKAMTLDEANENYSSRGFFPDVPVWKP